MGGEPFVLNSGDFPGCWTSACERAGFDAWRSEAESPARARAAGRRRASPTSWTRAGSASTRRPGSRSDRTGGVRLLIGGASSGQGIETVMAQIAGDVLTVPVERIKVFHGDTDLIPDGVGSWSSRSTVIGGSAVLQAAEATRDKALRVAAELLEASVGDLVLDDGARPRQRARRRPASRWARSRRPATRSPAERRGERARPRRPRDLRGPDDELPLRGRPLPARDRPGDRGDRGAPLLRRLRGGQAPSTRCCSAARSSAAPSQGLGGALYEELPTTRRGQPRATSFMDYLLPGATEVPTERRIA